MTLDQADLLRTATRLYQGGDIAKAEQLFGEALRQDQDCFPALKFLGKIMLERRNYQGAADILARAQILNPASPTVRMDMGLALEELKRPAEALASFDSAIALMPDLALAHYNRGGTLTSLQRPDEALDSYERAIALQPDFVEAHANRASVLESRGRYAEALGSYDKAIALTPGFDLFYNRGNCLWGLKRPAESLASYDAAIALQPGFAEAHANRAVVLQYLKRLDESLLAFDRAVALKPGLAAAWYNRGNSLKELKRLDDAIQSFDRAVVLKPDHASAIVNRSYCFLLKGELARGLPDYECRKSNRANGLDPARQLTPAARDAISGKTILVRYEIGLGDTIQYSRYIGILVARGARVLLSVQGPLRALFKTLAIPHILVDEKDPGLDYDYWIYVMSLHHLYHGEPENWPMPYLGAEPERCQFWKAQLGAGGFKIGVCWQTAGRREIFNKAFAPAEFSGISQLPSVRLIGVQKGDFRSQLEQGGLGIEYLGPQFDAGDAAFLDTAAVLKNCDLVITCDTATAHLAGALACPVWVALKYVPDCRWLLDRSDSPLYPTMRLFRQTAADDWAGAFGAMEKALNALLHEKPLK